MTLLSSANNIVSDTEFILRGRPHIYIKRDPRIDPWELHVLMYPSQKK